MRRRAAPLAFSALAAMMALAGCSSSEPHSPVDPEEAERSDYNVPLLAFVGLSVTGLLLLALLLRVRRRRRSREGGRDPATPRPADLPKRP